MLTMASIAVTWGLIGVIVRWTVLPAVVIVAARTTLGSLTVLAQRGPRQLVLAMRADRAWWRGSAVLGVLLAVHWLTLVAAQQRAPIGTVLLIVYLAPVIVTALAPAVLHEHVDRTTVVALAVAVVGLAVLVRPAGAERTGLVLAMISAVTYAAMTLCSKRLVRSIGPEVLAVGQLVVASVVLAPVAAFASWGPAHVRWLWLVALGVGFTGLLLPRYFAVLEVLPASIVGVLGELEPVAAVLFAWVFLHDRPTARTVLGGSLVVLAGIMVIGAASARSDRSARVVAR